MQTIPQVWLLVSTTCAVRSTDLDRSALFALKTGGLSAETWFVIEDAVIS